MSKQKKGKIYLLGHFDAFWKFLQKRRLSVPKGFHLRVNISDFFDEGNRQALQYASEKQTLKGLLPGLRLRASAGPIIDDKKSAIVRININEATDKWNRLALQHAKRRRGGGK